MRPGGRGARGAPRSPPCLLLLAVLPHLLAEAPADGCGHMVINEEGGTLASKNYPGTYPNYTFCERRIHVPEGKKLRFKFGDLDIESRDCESSYLKIFKGSSALDSETFCGTLNASHSEIVLDSNEATVQFASGSHVSGRGFLLNFATSDHPDLITCLERSNHFSESEFSRYCPAGCRDVAGDISGDVVAGYRDTTLLCKAAIHAGVIADELGGQINVIHHKGISRYEGILANGILSQDGSLSDRRFLFTYNGCSIPLLMESGTNVSRRITASSSWESTSHNGEVVRWSPERALLQSQGPSWASNHNTSREWLEIDLGERKRITGIITRGSTKPEFISYVQTYGIHFSKDRLKWRTYKGALNSEEKIFQGNDNFFDEARNNFLPPVIARYVRIVPHSWHQRIALKVGLTGCRQTSGNISSTHPLFQKPKQSSATSVVTEGRTSTERLPSEDIGLGTMYSTHPLFQKPNQSSGISAVTESRTSTESIPMEDIDLVKENRTITEDIPKEYIDLGMKLRVIVAPVVLCLLLLIGGICIFATLRKKKANESTSGSAEAQKTGCWKQIKHPFARQQSTEFTISYNNEKETLQQLDLVPCDMADYQLPLMIGTGTVTRKGSTFKPLDTEMTDKIGRAEIEKHYDYPHRASRHEYALPLTSQEPEYATPIIERHAMRENKFTSVSGYNVPILAVGPPPTFPATGISVVRDHSGGDYQSPQGVRNTEGVYDKPKNAATDICTDYQKPQLLSVLEDGYSAPRDCLKPISHTSVISV